MTTAFFKTLSALEVNTVELCCMALSDVFKWNSWKATQQTILSQHTFPKHSITHLQRMFAVQDVQAKKQKSKKIQVFTYLKLG